MALPQSASKNFVTLTDTYRDMAIEFPRLKAVTLAQWAYESGWGRSDLASKHGNFAGMKWGKVDADFGTPLQYGVTKYTEFTNLSQFILAYWHRLDHVPVFDGWRARAPLGPEAFLTFVTAGWLTGRAFSPPLLDQEREYIREVLSIATMRTNELFRAQETTHENPADQPAKPQPARRSWWWPHW